MYTSSLLLASVCAAGLANAAYTIKDSFNSTNFFDGFTFFSGTDPTNGFVAYQTALSSNNSGLAGYSDGAAYLGVDSTTVNPTGGRQSVRLESKARWTKGLFVADIKHMPGNACGVWPAFVSLFPSHFPFPFHLSQKSHGNVYEEKANKFIVDLRRALANKRRNRHPRRRKPPIQQLSNPPHLPGLHHVRLWLRPPLDTPIW